MNLDRLNELCALWQKRLRLQDWTVVVAIVGKGELTSTDNGAECSYVLCSKQAYIRLLDPKDYPKESPFEQDLEESLVHELLHLHFAPFAAKDGTFQDVAQEQAIHSISQALISLAREGAWEHRGIEAEGTTAKNTCVER